MPFVYSMNIVVVLIFIVCILIFIENRRCAVCLVGSCSNGPPCIVHYSYIMDNIWCSLRGVIRLCLCGLLMRSSGSLRMGGLPCPYTRT